MVVKPVRIIRLERYYRNILSNVVFVCGQCTGPVGPDDQYCRTCGVKLEYTGETRRTDA